MHEEFSDAQKVLLERFVTNTEGQVFVLKNLPEVIKGALFSRYSRSVLGLRSLLLKEFILNDESAFGGTLDNTHDGLLAIQKAQNFYDRILDGYGDDSIGELGGAHLAFENISMLAAKVVEAGRIGGSPLEKSTRYIYFDQKVNGEYRYYKEPVLLTSAFRELYLTTCDLLFDTYSQLIPPLTAQMEEAFPKEATVSSGAYATSIRAKVLDCLRGLLPASALTNMGVFGNGRFFESFIRKSRCHPFTEIQELGHLAAIELSKVIPSFIRRADGTHKTQISFARFASALKEASRKTVAALPPLGKMEEMGVSLVSCDADAPARVAAALLFEYSGASLEALQAHCKTLDKEDIAAILDTAVQGREGRRHKSPRALEHAFFTFEILADFGIYRDLQRHRMLTQEKQLLTCDFGYYTPQEIIGTAMEAPYRNAMEAAKEGYQAIRTALPEEAQYIVPMGYNIHWYFHVNLRALQWLCELRSAAAGHPTYRWIAQALAKAVIRQFPEFERFFQFVDYEGYDLGRLGQEQHIAEAKER